jgi:hypothetical protein
MYEHLDTALFIRYEGANFFRLLWHKAEWIPVRRRRRRRRRSTS